MKRILLKLSGEALAGDKKTGFDEETVRKVALQVKQLTDDAPQEIRTASLRLKMAVQKADYDKTNAAYEEFSKLL